MYKDNSTLPTLYTILSPLAMGPVDTAFHDIVDGGNGHYQAGAGWDAVTGWGSGDVLGWAACPFPFSVLGHYCSGRDFIQPLSTAISSSGSSINTICPECSNTCRWVLGIFSAISTAPAIGVTQS
jgi:hypothetical protein